MKALCNDCRDILAEEETMKEKEYTKRVRPFPKFKKLQHRYDGSIVALFEYMKYKKISHGSWWGLYYGLKISLTLSSLKIRIGSFEGKGWPVVQERMALRKFNKMGLK